MHAYGNLALKAKWAFVKAFGANHTAKICGHKTKLFSRVEVFGREVFCALKKGGFDYCPECRAKMAIRCAWCGRIIMPGDPITLYTPRDPDWKIPKHAVIYQREPVLQLVGCMRLLCSEGAIDRTGFWVEPGEVLRVASPMELVMATTNHSPCNDVCDINQAIPLADLQLSHQ
jgi:hypothetical protein